MAKPSPASELVEQAARDGHVAIVAGVVDGDRSFLGIVPERRIGVVVLSNTARPVDGIGARLLAGLSR